MACKLPPQMDLHPFAAPYVPSVPIAPSNDFHIIMPLILSRFDTIERMVLGLYQSQQFTPMMPPPNPVNAPHVGEAPPSDAKPSARNRNPVPIVDPDNPHSSPEHSAQGTPEPKECDTCHKPFNPSNSKWKICDSCDASRRKESRNTKLRKGKIPCDTEDCTNTVSPNSASGLCHVCWWKTHVKCHFCPGTLRSSEESHICGRCRNRFRTWHRISGKNGYRVTEQSGQVGRLFTKGGRFEPFDDQEEATAKLTSYREFIEVTALDETERRNAASRRRADRVKERDSHAEKALSKWKSGISVTFVPTEHEALQDANASCVEETSTHPVQHLPHLPSISGMSAAPSIGGRPPLPTHTTNREAPSSTDEGTGYDFPTSSGKYHTMLQAGFSKGASLEFDDVTFRPYGGYPRVPASSKRTPISESDSEPSLLPAGETFRSTRPGCAIPIVAPKEPNDSLFPKVPPTATRTNSTSVKPPLVKDRGSGIDDTFSSAPLPALDEALTTSVDVTLERVVAPQISIDSKYTSESLKGGLPKVPRLPQPPPTAAINAGNPSQAEISKASTLGPLTYIPTVEYSTNGSLTSESDRITKVQKSEVKAVSLLPGTKPQWVPPPPASDVTLPVITSFAKDTTPPKKSTFTSELLKTSDLRLEPPPHFLVDDLSCCTQMCSVKSCFRSGFDKHCVIPAHSGTAHRCDLCWTTYPIAELTPSKAAATLEPAPASKPPLRVLKDTLQMPPASSKPYCSNRCTEPSCDGICSWKSEKDHHTCMTFTWKKCRCIKHAY